MYLFGRQYWDQSICQNSTAIASRRAWNQRASAIRHLANVPTTDAYQELMNSSKLIGNTFKPFYGEYVGKTVENFLNEVAENLRDLKSAKTRPEIRKALNSGYRTTDQLAEFLVYQNPVSGVKYWNFTDLQGLFHKDLELSAQVLRLLPNGTQNYQALWTQSDRIADWMSDGMVRYARNRRRVITDKNRYWNFLNQKGFFSYQPGINFY